MLWTFSELAEHQIEGFADALIGILLDPVVPHLHVADGDGEKQLAAACLLLERFERSLAQERELEFAHCPLHAQQKTIVGVPGLVDAVLVNEERADQPAELDQRVPIATVAGEPRRLDREHGTHMTLTNGGEQTLEPWAAHPGAGPAQIMVDDDHIGPAQLAGPLLQSILAAPALGVVQQLVGGRLSGVDIGAACEMVRRDLGHHPPPSCSSAGSSSGSRRAAPGPGAATWCAHPRPMAPAARPIRTGPVGGGSGSAACWSPSRRESSRSELRHVSSSSRRSRRHDKGSLGRSPITMASAPSRTIQAGTWASVSSG
jgi:hypothetical protein